MIKIKNYGGIKNFKGGFVPFYLVPRRPIYRKNVIILINERCVSAAEYFAFAASSINKVTLIGRPTCGMVASPSMQSIYLPQGLKMEFYTAGLADNNGNFEVEWVGVEPDILIPYSIEHISSGKDADLSTAIELLKEY